MIACALHIVKIMAGTPSAAIRNPAFLQPSLKNWLYLFIDAQLMPLFPS